MAVGFMCNNNHMKMQKVRFFSNIKNNVKINLIKKKPKNIEYSLYHGKIEESFFYKNGSKDTKEEANEEKVIDNDVCLSSWYYRLWNFSKNGCN